MTRIKVVDLRPLPNRIDLGSIPIPDADPCDDVSASTETDEAARIASKHIGAWSFGIGCVGLLVFAAMWWIG